jgi:hypothetical protein
MSQGGKHCTQQLHTEKDGSTPDFGIEAGRKNRASNRSTMQLLERTTFQPGKASRKIQRVLQHSPSRIQQGSSDTGGSLLFATRSMSLLGISYTHWQKLSLLTTHSTQVGTWSKLQHQPESKFLLHKWYR